jgi:hypothetical protein
MRAHLRLREAHGRASSKAAAVVLRPGAARAPRRAGRTVAWLMTTGDVRGPACGLAWFASMGIVAAAVGGCMSLGLS